MLLVFTMLVFIVLLIFMIDRRSFFGGILFGFLTIFTGLFIFFKFLLLIADQGEIQNSIVLLVVYGLIPLLFIAFTIWLMYNSRMMRTKEGKGVTAKLSLALGLNLLLVVPLFLAIISGAIRLSTFWAITLTIFSLLDLSFVLIFIAYLLYSLFYQMIPIKKKIDYIIILGAGIKSEEVTPLLKSRLDKALQYQEKQIEKIKFVVSGGQGPDEPVSEAFAMRKYLQSQHVPNDQIIFEDQSTTTYENMMFSKRKIKEDWKQTGKPNILFSTSNYHVFRSALYARKAKVNAEGIGAPVALYFLPTALIREYIALLVRYKWFTISTVFFIISIVLLIFMPF